MKKLLLVLALIASHIDAAELMLSGTVVSDNKKVITSRNMGFVESVLVDEGDRVKKGDILYKIDSKEVDVAKREVELSLQMQKSQYLNARVNLRRNQRLYKKDMVSKFEVENLELMTRNLKDMVGIMEAKLQQVENQYNYLVVKAPNDGVIVQKNIKAGEMSMPGMPAMILTDLSDLKIVAEIAESDLKKAVIGKEVMIFIASVDVHVQGKISTIIPSLNPMTHTFKIKIESDFKDKNIYPGMFATISMK